MRRRSSDTARRAGLIGVALALAAGIAAAGARMAGRGEGIVPARWRGSAHDRYTCRCGARYRVSGTDRHRVYWPAGAASDEPVLGDVCVECEAPLPGGRAAQHA